MTEAKRTLVVMMTHGIAAARSPKKKALANAKALSIW